VQKTSQAGVIKKKPVGQEEKKNFQIEELTEGSFPGAFRLHAENAEATTVKKKSGRHVEGVISFIRKRRAIPLLQEGGLWGTEKEVMLKGLTPERPLCTDERESKGPGNAKLYRRGCLTSREGQKATAH